jgi:hypothetical protein
MLDIFFGIECVYFALKKVFKFFLMYDIKKKIKLKNNILNILF